MLPTDIHNAYITSPTTGKLHPAGRFLVHDGHLHHMEDYHGLLAQHMPEGAIDDYTLAKLGHPGGGLTIASHEAIRGGHRLDVVPEADLDPMPRPKPTPTGPKLQDHLEVKPPSVWHYHRAGHDAPHTLEAREGKYLLDGNPLKDHEVATILDNVRTKTATIRYPKRSAAGAIAKMEQVYASLRKSSEMEPDDAFAHLDTLHQGDPKTMSAIAALRKRVFEDPMVPGMGNRLAYDQFTRKQSPGAHVALDANSFKTVNDTYGHAAGDDAIKAIGEASKKAMAEVAPGAGKLFRQGGDEMHAYLPSHEHAAQFARALRGHMEQIVPVAGQHKLSLSMGIGDNHHTADKALYAAKAAKVAHLATNPDPGKTPNFAHSLYPGHEGAIPLDQHQLHQTPPQLEPEAPVPAQATG